MNKIYLNTHYISTHVLYTYYNKYIHTYILCILFSLRVYIKDIYCSNFAVANTKHIKNNWLYTESEA